MDPSEVVRDQLYYLGTYLKDDKYEPTTGTCTLLTRRFYVTRSPKGNLRLHRKTEAVEFPSEDAMVEAIEDGGWIELPEEADGNPSYVPEEFRDVRKHSFA